MLDTSTRLLRLLTTLQMRSFWTGAELAGRLEITSRTLRRDIDRLRSLGYTIVATSGPAGGYRMGQGAALPPLLLNDDEAVAIAVALRSAVDSFSGLDASTVSLLAKLNQLLPDRLRRRASAMQAATVSVGSAEPRVDAGLLTTIAAACRDRCLLTFPYRDRAGRASLRTVEPLRVAHAGSQLWYLVAWDRGRKDWRTLRVDRITGRATLGEHFIPRTPPKDVAALVTAALSYAAYPYRARFRLAGSAGKLAPSIPPWCGVLEPLDAHSSRLSIGGETLESIAVRALLCGTDFELLEPEALRIPMQRIAARLERAAGPTGRRAAGRTSIPRAAADHHVRHESS